MAGIEVIGIVLGAIPLLISGLEHYADGADTIRRAFRAGREFRILKQKLDDENLLFRNTITILLEECVDIETQKDLMKDVDGTIWKDMKVRDALENRLRDSYCSYISHVGKIQASLDKFNERLGITAQGQVSYELVYTVTSHNPLTDLVPVRDQQQIIPPSIRQASLCYEEREVSRFD